MLWQLVLILSVNLANLSPAEAYLSWLDAYHYGDGKTVYTLYNAYGQDICAQQAGSKEEDKLAEAALFFACRLLYQDDAHPTQERINAKHDIVAQEKVSDSGWMLQNDDGDLVMMMNEGKGWKVDNIFPKGIWEKEK